MSGMPANDNTARIQTIFRYHEATKHHYGRYARSLGFMDWDTQPNPFRSYADSPQFRLPLMEHDPDTPHDGLFLQDRVSPRQLTLQSLAGMIELSLGLSAWKKTSFSAWVLRMNPSSGNLHPTESYWILPPIDSNPCGIFHYNPFLHTFELRAELDPAVFGAAEHDYGSRGFFVALSSIHWRESWKYGERAFRYCNHDVGHALAALAFSARLMGWRATCVNSPSDDMLRRLLGFNRTTWPEGEAEEVDLLVWVSVEGKSTGATSFTAKGLESFLAPKFQGTPSRLSPEHHPWPIIESVAQACEKSETLNEPVTFPNFSPLLLPESTLSAARIIRQRRSAVDFDPARSVISRDHFLACLAPTLPRANCAPFDLALMEPAVHLFIFVHHVTGMESGFYALVRNPDHFDELKSRTHTRFRWESVDPSLPFFFLEPGDFRAEAKRISCDQAIAGESAFSLGMVARFREPIESASHNYKRLFWETGMIGQTLYLEAEAYGLRATGIGCFFDDPMHELCGFKSHDYQSLYHFTIGYPIEDSRITTLPPYAHLSV